MRGRCWPWPHVGGVVQAGESSKMVSVAVLDDAHEEGEEALTLALSNASWRG